MRKFFVCVLSFLLTFGLSISSSFAAGYDTKKLDAAITKVTAYYKKNKTLSSSDEVIAAGALGLNIKKDLLLDSDYQASLAKLNNSETTLGELTKGIIALILLGENPASYKGQNYVKTLESKVNKDGSIKGSAGANQDVYVLFALEAVNSSKVRTAANYFSKEALTSGAYWYEYGGVKSADDSTTAWAVEALDNADQKAYKTTVNKALAYLKTGLNEDGSYDTSGYGGNADTQACVLEALFNHDQKLVLNSTNKTNPADYLLSWQQSDGSFGATDYTTGEVTSNAYATAEAARSLGTYKYGSVYKVAANTYKANYLAKKISSVKLSKSSYTYNGKKQTPSVTVKYGKTTLKKNKDYTVTYAKGSKAIGQYQVTVTGIDDYKGTIKKTYTIKPTAVKGVKVTAARKALKVSFNKAKGNVKYQVAYKAKGAKKYTYVKTAKTALTIKNLKRHQSYSVKVRAYKTVSKKTISGSYTKVKKVLIR